MPKKKVNWRGDRYWGELIRFQSPSLYGAPIYYTDGSKIPYLMEVPKIKPITAKELVNATE